MTIRVFADKTVQFFPVQFTLYKLAKRDIVIVDDDGHPKTIAKQGQPNPLTFSNILLYRDVRKGESVKDTVKRFQKMLQDPDARWDITWQPETDAERIERYRENELEVVSDKPVTEPVVIKAPIIPVSDEDIIGAPDDGRIKSKRGNKVGKNRRRDAEEAKAA